MSEIVPFTDNFSDLSNLEGYQFEFHCERCGNGYRSPYVKNIKEQGKGFLRAANSLLGGKLNQISGAAETLSYDRGTNSKQKDKALADAVEAVKDQFKQCRGCGNWVCVAGVLERRGRAVLHVLAVRRRGDLAGAGRRPGRADPDKVREQDWTADLDLTTRAKVKCPECGAATDGGKFCPECGTSSRRRASARAAGQR